MRTTTMMRNDLPASNPSSIAGDRDLCVAPEAPPPSGVDYARLTQTCVAEQLLSTRDCWREFTAKKRVSVEALHLLGAGLYAAESRFGPDRPRLIKDENADYVYVPVRDAKGNPDTAGKFRRRWPVVPSSVRRPTSGSAAAASPPASRRCARRS